MNSNWFILMMSSGLLSAEMQTTGERRNSGSKVRTGIFHQSGKTGGNHSVFQSEPEIPYFCQCRGSLLEKALYSTWLTYLPANDFSYDLELKTDPQGIFV